jgi:hypothetical protein
VFALVAWCGVGKFLAEAGLRGFALMWFLVMPPVAFLGVCYAIDPPTATACLASVGHPC